MAQTPRTRRVQRARKQGMPVKDIADKEGISERQVLKLCSGKAFQKSLAASLQQTAMKRISNGAFSDRIAEAMLKKLWKEVTDPKSKARFTPKDIADLGKFSHLQHEQGVDYLKDSIRRGQEELDEQLKKDSAILDITPE